MSGLVNQLVEEIVEKRLENVYLVMIEYKPINERKMMSYQIFYDKTLIYKYIKKYKCIEGLEYLEWEIYEHKIIMKEVDFGVKSKLVSESPERVDEGSYYF